MAAKVPYVAGHAALRRARISLPRHIYLITVVTKDREPLFRDFEAGARCHEDRRILKDSTMLAWMLMPDHAHWLVQVGEADRLEKMVTRLKCASARNVNKVLGRTGSVWSKAYHDRALRDESQLMAAARYLVANPTRAGLVTRLAQYPFWNSIWL